MYHREQRTRALALLLGAILSLGAQARLAIAEEPRRAGPSEPFVLLEYFGSEKCLLCQKPTEMMREREELAREKDRRIFVLTYHIDYLEYPEWDDPFEQPQFSERQKSYNVEFGLRRAVPGQVVINGTQVTLVRYERVLDAYIERFIKKPARAGIDAKGTLSSNGRSLQLSYSVSGIRNTRREFFHLQAALAERAITREVTAGPNAGYTFEHVNVVRAFDTTRVDPERPSGTFTLNVPADLDADNALLVVFLQDPRTLEVWAAEELAFGEELSKPRVSKEGRSESGSNDLSISRKVPAADGERE